MNNPDVSIIIRTLNEERYLGDLLRAIDGQKSEFVYEVVLIDSGSTDKTLSIAEQFGCRILHISRSEFSFGRSLNRACEVAQGSYFVLVSGHCIPVDQYWLHNLIEPLKMDKAQYCYGRQLGGPETYWSGTNFLKYFQSESCMPQKEFIAIMLTALLMHKLGYKFDEDLTGLEDMHLAMQLIAEGGIVGYQANAVVYHIHHETWSKYKDVLKEKLLLFS